MIDEPLTDEALDAAGGALAARTGLSLSAGLRTALRAAVRKAALGLGVAPVALAARAAAGDAAALDALAEHALVGETFFWRSAEGLVALAGRLAARPGPVTVWCAGCASGEEPYGLAMALLEAGREGRGDRILATDLSAASLRGALAGRYGERSLRKLPPALARRWLRPGEGAFEVAPAVRELVELRRHNLLDDPPEAAFDAVVCRNVVIYFELEVARRVVRRLAAALAPGGLLLLGPVELSLAEVAGLEWEEEGGAVLLRRPGP